MRSGAPQALATCYIPAMSDRLFMALVAASAVALIGFAAVWPQGLGARSPGPFGQTPLQQTPAMRDTMTRAAASARIKHRVQIEAAAAQLRRVTAPRKSAAPNSGAPAGLRSDQ